MLEPIYPIPFPSVINKMQQDRANSPLPGLSLESVLPLACFPGQWVADALLSAIEQGHPIAEKIVALRAPAIQIQDTPATLWALLSPKQAEVARMLASGLTKKEIATQLGLETKTIEAHCFQAYRRLGIHNIAQLTCMAFRAGVLR
jgi:DNA-binding NarL/FixJ family response regulator